MPDLFDNPMGLMGFEFVEFASPTPGVLEPLFEQMGFTLVARHRSKDVLLYRQGDINFIVNREPRSLAAYFAAEHGPSACGLAFRVRDAHKAYALALERGAQPVDIPTGPMELRLPAIKGIGGAPLYLIDRFEDGKSIYDIDFEFLPGDPATATRQAMASLIDHLTHNVYRGRMAFWGGFYERLFGFREIRYFDIQGEYTGLTSRAMTAPDGLIRIPLNEERGQGRRPDRGVPDAVQRRGHPACGAAHRRPAKASVDALQLAGVPLMTRPTTCLLRDARRAAARPRPPVATRGTAGARHPARRHHQGFGGDFKAPAAADLQPDAAGAGVLRVHPARPTSSAGFGEGNFKALFDLLHRWSATSPVRRGAAAAAPAAAAAAVGRRVVVADIEPVVQRQLFAHAQAAPRLDQDLAAAIVVPHLDRAAVGRAAVVDQPRVVAAFMAVDIAAVGQRKDIGPGVVPVACQGLFGAVAPAGVGADDMAPGQGPAGEHTLAMHPAGSDLHVLERLRGARVGWILHVLHYTACSAAKEVRMPVLRRPLDVGATAGHAGGVRRRQLRAALAANR
jgi:4-hydroxyphenylpyruvate dioxygenase